MLREAEERKVLTGIKISAGNPSVSHILFADDILIFCKATEDEGGTVVQILKDYEAASGQKINFDKCGVSFKKRTSDEVRQMVRRVLQITEVKDQGKYL
ncbi:hypothetical protein LIER_29367 [Lithospermum erythrorhizon]|uniref:Reverse transcriptase domain-containing protein n=1 Tax=Lithospermum erythrorhizon TaxID=34254 RepID=A0AAV3RM94_LITER